MGVVVTTLEGIEGGEGGPGTEDRSVPVIHPCQYTGARLSPGRQTNDFLLFVVSLITKSEWNREDRVVGHKRDRRTRA